MEVSAESSEAYCSCRFRGLSSYSLNNGAEMPQFRSMMQDGCYTLENRSVLPSSSAVNWASMFMGAGPELHGYTEWGSFYT